MFTPLEVDTAAKMTAQVNDLMRMSNLALDRAVIDFQSQWRHFWDAGFTVEEMQAQLDILASTPAIDQGQETNALSAYFAKALRWIAFFEAENPDAFSNSRFEETEEPRFGTNEPYREFLTPGWFYTVDMQTGRMIVTAPCTWEEIA